MKRRRFLLKATVAMGGLAGCTATGGESPTGTETPIGTPTASPSTPEREPPDCVNPDRPEPENGSGNIEPAAYPEAPPAFDQIEAMADFIVAYEEAYRTNALLEKYGRELREVHLGIGEPRFFDSTPESTIARVKYTYGFDTNELVADSPTTYASYYIDDSVLSRAEQEGVLDDESILKPDPLTDGNVLQCFG